VHNVNETQTIADEALEKAKRFHDRIEDSDYLTEVLLECDAAEAWQAFREVMIRLSLAAPRPGGNEPVCYVCQGPLSLNWRDGAAVNYCPDHRDQNVQ